MEANGIRFLHPNLTSVTAVGIDLGQKGGINRGAYLMHRRTVNHLFAYVI